MTKNLKKLKNLIFFNDFKKFSKLNWFNLENSFIQNLLEKNQIKKNQETF